MTALDLAAILERAALLDARDYGHTADRLLQVDVPEMAAEIERLWTVEFAHAGCQGLREADNAELIRQRDETRALLARFVDDEPCALDHHGYCQNHGLSEQPCRNVAAKAHLHGGI